MWMLTQYKKLFNMFFRIMNDTVSALLVKSLLFILDLLASDTQVVITQMFSGENFIPIKTVKRQDAVIYMV